MTKSKIQIVEPITEDDFRSAYNLIRENLANWRGHQVEDLKQLSVGELLIAKNDDEVVGMLSQRRPGKIFNEIPDEYFATDKINARKEDIGHISVISVDKSHQGKGVGKLLVEEAIKLQREFGSKCIDVFAWQSSPGGASQKLFESFGFELVHLFKQPWYDHSKKVGPDNFWCVVCGNPCTCDELEMVKYL